MKTALQLTGLLFLFFCGCEREPNDQLAAVKAISIKLDAIALAQSNIWNNQIALYSNQVTMQRGLIFVSTNQPNAEQIERIVRFYHTNGIVEIGNIVLSSGDITLTNLYRIQNLESGLGETLRGIRSNTLISEGILTNTLADIYYTKEKVNDIGQDVRSIKSKVGAY